MTGEWPIRQLGEFIDVKHGFAFEGQYFVSDGQYRLLTPGNFADAGGFVDRGTSQKHYDGPVDAQYVLPPGAVLVAMTEQTEGLLGSAAIVPENGKPCLHNQRLGRVGSKNGADIDLKFVYYLLNSRAVRQQIAATASGTKIRHTSPTRIAAVSARIPPLTVQRNIATHLASLDDKIELNRRMNETLEAMAQAIFRDWFVNFGPTRRKLAGITDPVEIMGGLTTDRARAADLAALFPATLGDNGLPEGWEQKQVGELAAVKGGQQLPKEEFFPGGTVPVFGGAGPMGFTTKGNAEGFVITVGRVGAYCGRFFTHRGSAWVNNNASQIIPRSSVPPEWLHLALLQIDMTVIRRGAAQPFVSNGDLAQQKTIWPNTPVLWAFGEISSPLICRRENAAQEIQTLAATRDLLLPKLMSGEIRLRDAENAVAEAAR